jgi:hypothetical protein
MARPYAWSCYHRIEELHCISVRKHVLIGRSGFHGSKAMAARRPCGVHGLRCYGVESNSSTGASISRSLVVLLHVKHPAHDEALSRTLLIGSALGTVLAFRPHSTHISRITLNASTLWRNRSAHFKRYGGKTLRTAWVS